jgi:hypothetical protein
MFKFALEVLKSMLIAASLMLGIILGGTCRDLLTRLLPSFWETNAPVGVAFIGLTVFCFIWRKALQ